jgi:MFS family permease
MIAVALVPLRDDFDVTLATVSWLVSAFYLAAAVGQPLMGRLSDLLGPRRVFCAGWVLVGLTGALAPLAPSFGWLVLARVMQAVGTSAAFPAGLAMIRRSTGAADTAALGALAIAASVSAALGPVLGGVLVSVACWPPSSSSTWCSQ